VSDEIRARLHRIMAGRLRVAAAEQDLCANAIMATASLRRFAEVMAAGDARDVATHPDLAELNVQCDGYYDPA
jgi:hypothetical protein